MASKVPQLEGRALTFRAKAAWSVARTDAAKHFGRVESWSHWHAQLSAVFVTLGEVEGSHGLCSPFRFVPADNPVLDVGAHFRVCAVVSVTILHHKQANALNRLSIHVGNRPLNELLHLVPD